MEYKDKIALVKRPVIAIKRHRVESLLIKWHYFQQCRALCAIKNRTYNSRLDMTKRTLLALALMIPLMAACSGKPAEDDALESFNRGMFAFNEVVDNLILKPVATGYRFITPQPIRDRLVNASANLQEPLTMVNALLQGDVDRSMQAFFRFLINSTVGLAGMHDVASEAGIKPRVEDFGQTLATWGSSEGDYIVLPILGPSTTRDMFGRIADIFLDPLNIPMDREAMIVRSVAQGVIARESLLDPIDDIYATSLDPYASFRSIYLQRRDSLIRNSGRVDGPAIGMY